MGVSVAAIVLLLLGAAAGSGLNKHKEANYKSSKALEALRDDFLKSEGTYVTYLAQGCAAQKTSQFQQFKKTVGRDSELVEDLVAMLCTLHATHEKFASTLSHTPKEVFALLKTVSGFVDATQSTYVQYTRLLQAIRDACSENPELDEAFKLVAKHYGFFSPPAQHIANTFPSFIGALEREAAALDDSTKQKQKQLDSTALPTLRDRFLKSEGDYLTYLERGCGTLHRPQYQQFKKSVGNDRESKRADNLLTMLCTLQSAHEKFGRTINSYSSKDGAELVPEFPEKVVQFMMQQKGLYTTYRLLLQAVHTLSSKNAAFDEAFKRVASSYGQPSEPFKHISKDFLEVLDGMYQAAKKGESLAAGRLKDLLNTAVKIARDITNPPKDDE